MTNPTEPDALCVCGHPKSDHLDFLDKDCECLHENDTDKTTRHLFCECKKFCPSASPAHDTLAPQLRERLAEAERELAEAKDELALIRYLVASSGIEIAETDKTGYIVSVLTSVLKDTDELWKAANKREREWATKWQEARAEAADLRARLAALHPLADMAAGLLAEKGEESQAVKNILALKNEHCLTWRDKPDSFWFFGLLEEVGELGSALIGEHKDSPEWELTQISAIAMNWLEKRNAQRPEAEVKP